MKKHLFATAALAVAVAFATTANAQFELAANTKRPAAAPAALDIKSTPVYKKFVKQFPDGQDDTWTKTREGFAVRFTVRGIVNRAYLDKRGNFDGLIRYYGEKDLPQDVRHQVKSTYYDYSIRLVQEVTRNGATAYLVTVEDKTTLKIIRVVDGEMDVREAFTKAE